MTSCHVIIHFFYIDSSFVLTYYKTDICKRPPRLCRQGYACPFYHNNKDRRRGPKVFKYRCVLSIYLSISLSIHLSIHSSIHSFIPLSIHRFIPSSIHLSIHSFHHLSIHPSIYLAIHSSIHLFVDPFIFRSTPCPNVKVNDEWGDPVHCEQGDQCCYCHTRTEQQFHPEVTYM